MTWTNPAGKRMRLWIPEEVEVGPDEQAFMDLLVSKIVGILENEPIDIYVNPTFLPAAIAAALRRAVDRGADEEGDRRGREERRRDRDQRPLQASLRGLPAPGQGGRREVHLRHEQRRRATTSATGPTRSRCRRSSTSPGRTCSCRATSRAGRRGRRRSGGAASDGAIAAHLTKLPTSAVGGAVPRPLPRPSHARRRSGGTAARSTRCPPEIEVLTRFGERADFSPDGRAGRVHGEELRRRVRDRPRRRARSAASPATCPGAAFLRVMHLPSGDYLLIGPDHFEDVHVSRSRDNELWFLSRRPGSRPVKLGQRMSEGAAVSKTSATIGFSVGHAQDASLPEGATQLVVADVDAAATPPRLLNRRVVHRSASDACFLEAQDFFDQDRQLTFTLLRAGRPGQRVDARPGDRRDRQPFGLDRLLQRGRGPLPGRTARLRGERPPVARLRRRPELPQHRRLEAAPRRHGARLHAPHALQRLRRLEGVESGGVDATGGSWPSRPGARRTRPASVTGCC